MSAVPQVNVIAERELLLIDDKGQRKRVSVKLGKPYWVDEGIEAVCPVFIEGMLGSPSDISGMDLFDAVECAINFVNSYLKNNPAGSLSWPSGEPYEGEDDA